LLALKRRFNNCARPHLNIALITPVRIKHTKPLKTRMLPLPGMTLKAIIKIRIAPTATRIVLIILAFSLSIVLFMALTRPLMGLFHPLQGLVNGVAFSKIIATDCGVPLTVLYLENFYSAFTCLHD